MKKLLFLIGALLAGATHAAPIATFNPGFYIQDGVVTNNFSQTMVGFQIDFVPDGGVTAIWDTTFGGSPAATFTNLRPSNGAFTATWTGLSVGTGGNFAYTDMDYDGWDGISQLSSLAPNLLGDEIATIFFADGSSVSAFFTAGSAQNTATLVFDDANLVNRNATPEPGSLALLGLAFAGLGWSRRQRRAA